MKLALIDFDGTLVDHRPSMEAAALEVLGKPLTLEEISLLPVVTRARLYDVNMAKYAHLYEGHQEIIAFVKELESRGFETKLLTARLHKDIGTIRNVLNSLGLNMEIICRHNNTIKDQDYKREYILSLDAKVIVLLEDKKRNIEHIRQHMPEIQTYLIVDGRLQKE